MRVGEFSSGECLVPHPRWGHVIFPYAGPSEFKKLMLFLCGIAAFLKHEGMRHSPFIDKAQYSFSLLFFSLFFATIVC